MMAAGGVLRPGDRLPTLRQLEADLGINRNTVARAYGVLREDGVIVTRSGGGSRVAEGARRLTAREKRARADRCNRSVERGVFESSCAVRPEGSPSARKALQEPPVDLQSRSLGDPSQQLDDICGLGSVFEDEDVGATFS